MNGTSDGPTVPRNAWYAVATSAETGRAPLGRRVLGEPLVLYRLGSGEPAALADRCVHRPYPLSLGRVEGDNLVCGYSGFTYAPDGRCVRVPTQDHVPIGAAVRAFPVRESGGFVWAWAGHPNLAGLRPPPQLPWLTDPGWTTFGAQWETAAGLALLQDNFADITHVAVVDPFIAPPVLHGQPPPLEVEVSETEVSFSRDFPPAPVQSWQAELLGLPRQAEHAQREEGAFVSPGLWVDRWDVTVRGHGGADGVKTFRFTHALTPVDERTTRHSWRVSRNFAPGEAATGTLTPIFTGYYQRMREILQTMQQVIDADGPRPDVSVAADAAGIQVRKIMRRLAAEEGVRAGAGPAGPAPRLRRA